MFTLLGWILTVAITFPLSFLLARACLKGVIHYSGLDGSAHHTAHTDAA